MKEPQIVNSLVWRTSPGDMNDLVLCISETHTTITEFVGGGRAHGLWYALNPKRERIKSAVGKLEGSDSS